MQITLCAEWDKPRIILEDSSRFSSVLSRFSAASSRWDGLTRQIYKSSTVIQPLGSVPKIPGLIRASTTSNFFCCCFTHNTIKHKTFKKENEMVRTNPASRRQKITQKKALRQKNHHSRGSASLPFCNHIACRNVDRNPTVVILNFSEKTLEPIICL